MKKIILFIIGIVVIVGDGWLVWKIIDNQQLLSAQKASLLQTASPSAVPVVRPTVADFTGAIAEPAPTDAPTVQTSALTNALPIQTAAFNIAMDYKNNIFVVMIAPPVQANTQVFQQWMVANNYNQIPQNKFKIVNQ